MQWLVQNNNARYKKFGSIGRWWITYIQGFQLGVLVAHRAIFESWHFFPLLPALVFFQASSVKSSSTLSRQNYVVRYNLSLPREFNSTLSAFFGVWIVLQESYYKGQIVVMYLCEWRGSISVGPPWVRVCHPSFLVPLWPVQFFF